MKKLKGNEIINMYLNFFGERGHTIIESASLIPKDDPTVLWINAGVTPLKKYFDGTIVPKNKRLKLTDLMTKLSICHIKLYLQLRC